MKTSLITLTGILSISLLYPNRHCQAQGYLSEKVLYLDQDGNSVRQKNAAILKEVIQLSDTLWKVNLYHANGPIFRSWESRDPNSPTPDGSYMTYSPAGLVDTVGWYSNGKREGFWNTYTSWYRLVNELYYKGGDLVWTKDSVRVKYERDSLAAMHKADSNTTFKKVEIESAFPGGPAAWLRYLNGNLRYPDYDVKHNIQGIVVVGFIVDKEGHIPPSSVWVDRSVEYNADQEALRIIFTSPDWTPAVQNGKNVKSYKKQPIVFRF